MLGYSQTPLVNKLGIKENTQVTLLNAPAGYTALLEPLPTNVTIRTGLPQQTAFIHYFVTSKETLVHMFPQLKQALTKEGILWISWPKQRANTTTDLTETDVQQIGLQHGLVDVKVCAIDEFWSGLKFVYRLHDR